MGKGKGKPGKLRVNIKPYSWLVLLSYLRFGILYKVFNYISVRTSFKVGLAYYSNFGSNFNPLTQNSLMAWTTSTLTTKGYIKTQVKVAQDNVLLVKRRLLSSFYFKIFL